MNVLRWYSGLSGSRQIIVTGMAGLILLLLWASFAEVEEVTRGEGRIIPSSRAKVVQSAEPATIREILVRSGQLVRKGQLLVRLDDSDPSSELGKIEAENRSLAARAARLGQEGGAGTGCAVGPDGSVGTDCREEAALQQVRAAAHASRMAALRAAVEQRRRDMAEAQATAGSLRSSLQLAQDQVAMLSPLAAKSIVPQTELMSAQREATELQGRLAAAEQAATRAAASIAEAQAQLSQAAYDFRQEALNERSQLTARIAVNAEAMRGAAGRLQRTELRSPVTGIVNDVQVTTVGGFVQPGQQIAQVVPLGDKLLVEARVTPRDIAFINVGDRANVKVSAYDFSIYGGLTGEVVQISADSIYDEDAKQPYFTVVVETDRAYLQSAGRRLPISPGMMCTVEIITGRKSILAYLLQPALKVRSEAFRER
ncbi:MAG: HlyD family type I secretion periplasmic adaptor subunit [Cypionkella sp.]